MNHPMPTRAEYRRRLEANRNPPWMVDEILRGYPTNGPGNDPPPVPITGQQLTLFTSET